MKLLNHGVKSFLVPEESNKSAITEVYETVTYSSNNSIFHVEYASRILLSLVSAVVSRWNLKKSYYYYYYYYCIVSLNIKLLIPKKKMCLFRSVENITVHVFFKFGNTELLVELV